MSVTRKSVSRKIHLFAHDDLNALCGAGHYAGANQIEWVIAPHDECCAECVAALHAAAAGGMVRVSGALVADKDLSGPVSADWFKVEIERRIAVARAQEEAKRNPPKFDRIEFEVVG
jgi:hypothetical protein